MRTKNSQNHSYVHYSQSKFAGEWFTNHSNHIRIFTPVMRIVTTKVASPLIPCKILRETKRRFLSIRPAFSLSLSVNLSNYQSILVMFSQFWSGLVSFSQLWPGHTRQKRRNFLLTGRWGKKTTQKDPFPKRPFCRCKILPMDLLGVSVHRCLQSMLLASLRQSSLAGLGTTPRVQIKAEGPG